jgi:hypothetical protein
MGAPFFYSVTLVNSKQQEANAIADYEGLLGMISDLNKVESMITALIIRPVPLERCLISDEPQPQIESGAA